MVDKAGKADLIMKQTLKMSTFNKYLEIRKWRFQFCVSISELHKQVIYIYEVYLCKYISILYVVCFVELASYLWNLLVKKKYFFFHAYFVEVTSN